MNSSYHKPEPFIYNGLLDICEVHRTRKECLAKYRSSGDPEFGDYRLVGGVRTDYITRISHFKNPNMGWGLSHAEDAGDWVITPIPRTMIFKDPRWEIPASPPVAIWHKHLTSQLLCATFHFTPKKWYCCVCNEETPKGILFTGATYKLRNM